MPAVAVRISTGSYDMFTIFWELHQDRRGAKELHEQDRERPQRQYIDAQQAQQQTACLA